MTNTVYALDPDNSVIKRLWCMYKNNILHNCVFKITWKYIFLVILFYMQKIFANDSMLSGTSCLFCFWLFSKTSTLKLTTCRKLIFVCVCVEVLRPSQSNGVMLSAVSLPNHTLFLGRLSPLSS